MELRHLRYFVAVAEELHFGRAAERLCIAQPPLSQQIRQLEGELGFTLFTRTNRRVELTPAGAMFLEEARAILAGLEKATQAARRVAKGEEGWLGIGFVATAAYDLLPRLLPRFRQLHPNVELVLRELVTARQVQALHDRRIHVGLARPIPEENTLAVEAVIPEELVAVLPRAHPLAAQKRFSLAALAAEPFILFPQSPKPSYADTLYAACEAAGFTPHVVQEAAEMHTALALVAAGLGVTLAPTSARNVGRRGIVYRQLAAPAPKTELGVITRRNDDTPTLRAFLQILHEVQSNKKSAPFPVSEANGSGKGDRGG